MRNLDGITTGVYRVTTISGSDYLLDLDRDRMMRTPAMRMDGFNPLRRDGEWERLVAFARARVGSGMILIVDLKWRDVFLTTRRSTEIVSIEPIRPDDATPTHADADAAEPPQREPRPKLDPRWDGVIGSFYDTDRVATYLGRAPGTVRAMRRRGELLGIRSRPRGYLYPNLQFHGGHTVPHLAQVIHILRNTGMTDLTICLWLTGALNDWHGRTATQMLLGNQTDVDAVILTAQRDAERRTH